jgi:segregation and condensation protein A
VGVSLTPPAVSAGTAAAAPPTASAEEGRFPIDVPGYRGTLEQLVSGVRHGEVDPGSVPVSAITAPYRQRLTSAAEPDAQEIADFLDQASRLVALKAARLIPDAGIDLEAEDGAATDTTPAEDAGSRLAEYRLFRAAVDSFLAGATEQDGRSFLAAISPEVVPAERLTISQERLVDALRGALARLPETSAAVPVSLPATSVSVDERAAALRVLLAERATVPLEEVFTTATTRLEAVATFLALLELLRRGEIRVEPDAHGVTRVSAVAGVEADAGLDGLPAPGDGDLPAEPAVGEGSS